MIKKIVGLIIYKTIGQVLPNAHQFGVLGKIGKLVRSLAGKMMLDSCGKNVNIYRKASFSTRIELGDNSDIGYKSKITGKCIIGNNVIMGPNCTILTVNHRHDRTDVAIKYQGTLKEMPVIIEDDSWIGTNVILLPGVHIGKGSIIGAGAVVSKDIPEYSVAVGNPAIVVKKRK